MTTALAPIEFDAPLANPSPVGLYSVGTWFDETGPSRFLNGVLVRPFNYGGELATGVWGAPWCGDPTSPGSPANDLKFGERLPAEPPFHAFTVWGYDQCDPTPRSRAEVDLRAQQNLRLQEQVMVERMFADILIDEVTANPALIVNRPTLREAVSYLEGQMAKTGTLGVFHASAEAASLEWGLVLPKGTGLFTPLGNQWAFGGGYVDGLGDVVVATSPIFGWRDAPSVRPAFDQAHDVYATVAERSVAVGYERLIAAVRTNIDGS